MINTTKSFWKITQNERYTKIPNSKLIFFLRDCIVFSSLQHEIFLKILPKYIRKKDRVLEIGSGPGRNLVIINKMIGSRVFGIENNPSRYNENLRIFKENNIPTSRIFNEDFEKYHTKDKYDVVFSSGFIEHFSNPADIIIKQLKLVKNGGILICLIPNFTGLNYQIQDKIDKKILEKHNTAIMNLEKFKNLFKDLEDLYCGYCGFFSFRIFSKYYEGKITSYKIFKPIQVLLNITIIPFICLFYSRKIKTSPYLIYRE